MGVLLPQFQPCDGTLDNSRFHHFQIVVFTTHQKYVHSIHSCTFDLNTSHDWIFPNYQNYECCEKYLKDNKHMTVTSIWGENMPSHIYLSLDIICSEKWMVFLKLRSRKTIHFWEQIMSMESCCFFLTWAANQFRGGVIATKIFGILGAITLFPLKVCFRNS